MKIFCVIPAYKEKGNLQELSDSLVNIFLKNKIGFKILYVIQGNDGSRELIKKIQKKRPQIEYIYFENPLGIGNAYKAGFTNIPNNFSHILTMDADLNHNPNDLPKFIKTMISNHSDIVIGSRYITGGSFNDKRIWKRIISNLTNKLLIFLLRLPIHDISSGYRLIKSETVFNILPKLTEKGYPSYMEFILNANNLGSKINEVPITYTPRIWGKSKMGKIRTLIDYLKFLPKVIFTF
jgi:dolichol-phosphate mannosyltransferase